MDLETYLGVAVGLCETDRGTRLPPDIARRIACDATLQLLIRDHRGVVLDLGRSARRFSDDQRRALLGQYPTCVAAGCSIPASDCDMHHLHWWTDHGPTDLGNGVPVCWHHHDQIHHHHLRLRGEPDGSITSHDRHGTIIGVTHPRQPIEPIPIPISGPGPGPGPDGETEPLPRIRARPEPAGPTTWWYPHIPRIRLPRPPNQTSHPPDTRGASEASTTPPTQLDPTQPDISWPDLGIELQLVGN